MKTTYKALTKRGEWIVIKSNQPIRNTKTASQMINEEIIKIKIGTIIDLFKKGVDIKN